MAGSVFRWYYTETYRGTRCVSEFDNENLAEAMRHVYYQANISDDAYEIESVALVDVEGTVYTQKQIDEWVNSHPRPSSPPMEEEPDTFVEWNGEQWKVEYR